MSATWRRRLAGLVLVLVLVAGGLEWMRRRPAPGSREVEAVFRQQVARFDVIDQDGCISAAEWQRFGGRPQDLARFDRDQDGRLDWTEFRAAFEATDPRALAVP